MQTKEVLKKIAILILVTIIILGVYSYFKSISKTKDLDENIAQIETAIESITTLVDIGRFDILKRFYDDEVVADYSSLWGTEPRKLTKDNVGSAWAGFLPGFNTTRHDITNIKVKFLGSKANAISDITASHWLNGEAWIIRGHYFFELVKNTDKWVVKKWKFILVSESGSRILVDEAEKRVKEMNKQIESNHLILRNLKKNTLRLEGRHQNSKTSQKNYSLNENLGLDCQTILILFQPSSVLTIFR